METQFSVEAKSFEFSVVEGALGGGKKEGLLRCCILGILCTASCLRQWRSYCGALISTIWIEVELNKVMAFFEATISPSGASPLAEKKIGKKAWLGLRFDPALHDGERSLLVEGTPLYADAVRSVASSSASFGEQLDKNRHVGELELGPSLDMGLPNAGFASPEVQFVGSSTVSLDVAGAPTFVPPRLEDPASCDSKVIICCPEFDDLPNKSS
ncbi:hypothetical protein FH972_001250 [Carpinus fangiana]|uniref:Uncharacterized protein n=1 Tax=Carpinus fangiana TaxID=176857 RepID=A0A5N6QBH5_9ROSI|nr:hypothetical protein FH972_001250 [Carpinus fangiana]